MSERWVSGMVTRAAAILPFCRIGLYALAGYLAAKGHDPVFVDQIRTDPELLAAVTACVAGAWYGVAKWRGWKT